MQIDHALDGDSRFSEICGILSVGCAIIFTVVCLRSYVRLVILRTFGPDDGVMVATLVLAIGTAVAIGLGTSFRNYSVLVPY